MILNSKSKLRSTDIWKQIWISQDQTKYQRQIMKNLRQELLLKRKYGDMSWIIKYTNGTPSLHQKNL